MKNHSMIPLIALCFIPGMSLLVSCSTPATATSDELPQLFGFLDSDNFRKSRAERSQTETRTEREQTRKLKEIADRPSSNRPPATDEPETLAEMIQNNSNRENQFPGNAAERKVASADTPPAPKPARSINRTWDKDEMKSSRINIGDIFSEKEGMRLHKAASVSDAVDSESQKGFFSSITKTESYKVPLTISQEELAELKRKAKKDAPLPTRSVALDFESKKKSAKPEDLELLFGRLTAGSVPELKQDKAAEDKLNKRLKETKARLAKGEKLYVVTGVTESDSLSAKYPGAPVGNRDAEPIKNAVETMFPQLDELEATQSGEKVELSRDPGLYWGFEAREIKLENDQIVIERDSSIQH